MVPHSGERLSADWICCSGPQVFVSVIPVATEDEFLPERITHAVVAFIALNAAIEVSTLSRFEQFSDGNHAVPSAFDLR